MSRLELGRSLPSLLDEACTKFPNPQALNHWSQGQWQPMSNHEFRAEAQITAKKLSSLGLQPGDRVAMLMQSDRNFALIDMACMMAGLVDVPIDLSQTVENILWILQHSGAKFLVLSDQSILEALESYLAAVPQLQAVILVEQLDSWRFFPHPIPVYGLDHLPVSAACPEAMVLPPVTAIATIIYIPNALGQLQGVMLSQQNLSANAIAAFSGIANLKWGPQEQVLSFLPLTHVFARSLLYGHLLYGHSLYFTTANRLLKQLKQVQPTILATVPVMLEKVYEKLMTMQVSSGLERGIGLDSGQAQGVMQFKVEVSSKPQPGTAHSHFLATVWARGQRGLVTRAIALAQRYRLGTPPAWPERLPRWLYRRTLYPQLLAMFGGRLKILLCGGAALKPEIANLFAGLGLPILQGYGLTQTSSVLCCNRGVLNRAGTVGMPIAGAELAIAPDHEILVKGPFVTLGYFQDEAATRAAFDNEGWFHTGDLGEFTPAGFLKITGLKKHLFKLQTGKYVSALALEQKLMQSPWVQQAVVVGEGRKFCGVLILPNLPALRSQLANWTLPPEALLAHPCTRSLYQSVIDAANCHLPSWSSIKQFRLVLLPLDLVEISPGDGAMTLTAAQFIAYFADVVEDLYRQTGENRTQPQRKLAAHSLTAPDKWDATMPPLRAGSTEEDLGLICLLPPPLACPVIARSLEMKAG